jgi:hypothetical protein
LVARNQRDVSVASQLRNQGLTANSDPEEIAQRVQVFFCQQRRNGQSWENRDVPALGTGAAAGGSILGALEDWWLAL